MTSKMMKQASIILGLGFGDEGKGMTTDYLAAQNPKSIVIRFSGGHQVGHTVHLPDCTHHVFSNFGSGTLRDVPTFWSRYCTLYPVGLVNEYEALTANGFQPILYLDPQAMITTPYDIAWNRALEKLNRHGSVGVGFGATIERNETPFRLTALDLHHPFVFQQKMKAVAQYYHQKIQQLNRPGLAKAFEYFVDYLSLDDFKECVELARQYSEIRYEYEIFLQYEYGIFEGSQGILLDMDHGFFPHVTRSRTTSANAMEMIRRHSDLIPDIYYISRAYQSRHGNGPMTNEGFPLALQHTENETNQSHEWQGHFRRTILDVDLLRYTLHCDAIYAGKANKHLVITCLDQIVGDWMVSNEGEMLKVESAVELAEKIEEISFERIFENRSIVGRLVCLDRLRMPVLRTNNF